MIKMLKSFFFFSNYFNIFVSYNSKMNVYVWFQTLFCPKKKKKDFKLIVYNFIFKGCMWSFTKDSHKLKVRVSTFGTFNYSLKCLETSLELNMTNTNTTVCRRCGWWKYWQVYKQGFLQCLWSWWFGSTPRHFMCKGIILVLLSFFWWPK